MAVEVGEVVVYYVDANKTVFATVLTVIFWDLVDLQLEDGTRLANVRRVLEVIEDGQIKIEAAVGRFKQRGYRP